eukprot:CAMPEP_0183392070 /NCGR_PEP_ID=MMETSP0370-20130417/6882_1 /TAXON_ID=268820 /ORGANISM="Peridinium aciculiferum, Strain PAER-2" /LENGTH=171 /DNA_ID=CAMNT_0025571915 /DNA_START=260 /DNA_END=774 /DNA_ORIENTATION=-
MTSLPREGKLQQPQSKSSSAMPTHLSRNAMRTPTSMQALKFAGVICCLAGRRSLLNTFSYCMHSSGRGGLVPQIRQHTSSAFNTGPDNVQHLFWPLTRRHRLQRVAKARDLEQQSADLLSQVGTCGVPLQLGSGLKPTHRLLNGQAEGIPRIPQMAYEFHFTPPRLVFACL